MPTCLKWEVSWLLKTIELQKRSRTQEAFGNVSRSCLSHLLKQSYRFQLFYFMIFFQFSNFFCYQIQIRIWLSKTLQLNLILTFSQNRQEIFECIQYFLKKTNAECGCHHTCADDVDVVVEHFQIEDVLRVDHLLPDREWEPIWAVGRVEDAVVVSSSEMRLDDALKRTNKFWKNEVLNLLRFICLNK